MFEQVQDSASGNITYKHYIIAGGARVGVETLQADNTGTQTADTLSFFVHDEVGSVVAAVTENLGGSNQQLVVYSHDVWGKARPASGSNAYADPLPATYLPGTSTLAGQQEGFAGHEDLEDIGIVDMEGRIYDPEVGRFLSPDPNVQYPDSTQGYNRYTYVNNNPLSLSDPTGYFSFSAALSAGDPTAGFDPQDYGKAVGFAGPIVGAALNAVPGCQGWCDLVVTAASQAESGYLETGNVGDGIQQGVIAGVEAFAFSEAGGAFGSSPSPGQLFERSVIEGVIGGVGAAADGGDFGSGFAGAFVASEAGPLVSRMGPGPSQVIVTALVGGTATRLAGGNFAEGAFAAALQNLFNEQRHSQPTAIDGDGLGLVEDNEGYSQTPYLDSAGYFTIGYGHVITDGDYIPLNTADGCGYCITDKMGNDLLAVDLASAEHAVNAYVHVPLTQVQYNALVDFTFNEGSGALHSSTALKLLNAGDYAGAADALLMWNKVSVDGQKVSSQDLMDRRNDERNLFLNGTY